MYYRRSLALPRRNLKICNLLFMRLRVPLKKRNQRIEDSEWRKMETQRIPTGRRGLKELLTIILITSVTVLFCSYQRDSNAQTLTIFRDFWHTRYISGRDVTAGFRKLKSSRYNIHQWKLYMNRYGRIIYKNLKYSNCYVLLSIPTDRFLQNYLRTNDPVLKIWWRLSICRKVIPAIIGSLPGSTIP